MLIAISLATAAQTASAPQSPAPSDFSKEAYVIERLYTRVHEESDGTGFRERTAEVKVLSQAGVKTFAVLTFPYTSANEAMEFDYVRVRKPDGTVVQTPDYNIQDMPAEVSREAPLYSDVHEKHVAVKGLAPGDTLEYVARARALKPQVPGQFWYEQSLIEDAIARDERLEINVPRDKNVKIVSPEFKPEVKDEGDRRVYRWTHQNLTVKEKDPEEIPRRIPKDPDVRVTTFASWEEVGRWYAGLQKEPLTVTPAIQAKAAELTKGLKTDDEKVHALYNFVSLKYHYIGLDFGIGRYQPHAADDVLENGYGDCKDKHTLLASLLKAAGIDAWPVLIHATRKLDPEVPSPAQFNHVITVVPLNGSLIWLDTTPEVAPYRMLMLTLRNKQALVIPTNQAPKLMTTPEPLQPQEQEFSMQGKLGPDGVFTGHAEVTYDADSAVLMREAFRRVPESQWKELMQRISAAMSFGGEVSNVKVTPPDEIDNPFQISYDYERKNYSDWENRRITPPLPPLGLESYKGSREKKPQEPVLLGSVGKISYRSRLQLPEGYEIIAPAPVHLGEPYADYDSRTNVEDGVMTTTRTLAVKKTEVALSEWDRYRKFGEAIYDDEFNYMTLEHSGRPALKKRDSSAELDIKVQGNEKDSSGPDIKVLGGAKEEAKAAAADVDELFRDGYSALQDRDFERAEELFRKVIAQNPNYKDAHFNLGVALASRNNMEGAIKEFRKEEEASPRNQRSYQVVAVYLMTTGRRDEAIEEWRKLLKVDPQNRMAAEAAGGLLYEAEKYPEAVSVLEPAVNATPDSPSLLLLLGRAYLKTGNNEKALPALRGAIEQKNNDPNTLNTVAYSLAESKVSLDLARQYAEKSVAKLEEESKSSDDEETGLRVTYELSLVWDTLGWVYFQQGDAQRAEGPIRAAWLLGEDPIVGEHLGEIYEKEGKKQQAAHAYEFALSVSSLPSASALPFGMSEAVKAQLKLASEIKARYSKLTGKEPALMDIHRLPNGEWSKSPAEQLRLSREVTLHNEGKRSGTAEFLVKFKPGAVESATVFSGDDSLAALAEKLKGAHYPIEFPAGSGAVLTLRLDVRCQATAPCTASLVVPAPAQAAFPPQG